MSVRSIKLVLVVLTAFSANIYPQLNELGKFELKTKKSKKVVIPFELINNLIVIPVSVNGSDTLKLVLDTGVGATLITEIPLGEEIGFEYLRTVKIGGMGDGEFIDVLYSAENTLEFGKAVGKNQDILVMLKDIFNLSSLLGTNVNGLIGYSLFKDFIVEIDYKRKLLILHEHDKYEKKYFDKKRSKYWSEIPLTIEKQKPYVDVTVNQKNGMETPVKLLLDSGASHAMALYHTTTESLHLPEERIRSFLGNGISGEIHGYLGRINSFNLDKHKMEEVVVAYPDEEGIKQTILYSERDGSIGADVLRKYKIFFNYKDESMIIRPQKAYHEDFSYNISGIEISTPFPNIPLYAVSHVREGSIAEQVGIQKEDFLIEINGEGAIKYSLNDLHSLFQKEGKRIWLKIKRGSEILNIKFKLENELN